MTALPEPEIVLYDLACTKNICFSPVVWRIRLMLNYKRIPYRTIFLEFPDIEPTLQELGIPAAATESTIKYTVPTIHHIPTNKYITESAQIAEFLESTYPTPPVPLTSALGREIESKSRAVIGTVFGKSVMAREVNILSPRAGEYFRKTRETKIGRSRLEDLLLDEDETWHAADGNVRAVDNLMQRDKADRPFLLGDRPSYTDFFIAGALQSARVVDEGVFQRISKYDGFRQIYEACLPYMEKKD